MKKNLLNKIPRTLFVSDSLPPFVGGSATLMHNLFLGLDTSESFLISQSIKGFSPARTGGHDPSCSLKINREEIAGIPDFFSKGAQLGLPSLAIMSKVPSIVNSAVRAGKEMNAEVIMTCWPSTPFTIAGCLAAKRLNLPLIVYLHDLWYETRQKALQRILARFLEPKVLKAASDVLVITEPSADYLKGKFGINCHVLEHSVNSQLWPLDENIVKTKQRPRKVLMLGSVNKYNQDSVIAFSKAVAKSTDLELTILTGQTIEQLEKIGLDCSRIHCAFVSRDQLKNTILSADALYLALGFDTPVQQEVEVVIPTRLMDYLASGIPIIAHGPSNTWTVQEAQNKGWGFAIDSLDEEVIHKSLAKFLNLSDYSEIVQSSWQEAKRRDYVNQSKLLAHYLTQVVIKNKR